MSGPDFFDKRTRVTVLEPVVGPAEHPDASTASNTLRPIGVADMTLHRLLEQVLQELRAIHIHLSIMTDNDSEEVRRDASG